MSSTHSNDPFKFHLPIHFYLPLTSRVCVYAWLCKLSFCLTALCFLSAMFLNHSYSTLVNNGCFKCFINKHDFPYLTPLSSLFILGTLLSCIISVSLYSRDFHPCTTNLTDLNSPVINCNIFEKCNWWTELCFIPNMHSFGEYVTWLFIRFLYEFFLQKLSTMTLSLYNRRGACSGDPRRYSACDYYFPPYRLFDLSFNSVT